MREAAARSGGVCSTSYAAPSRPCSRSSSRPPRSSRGRVRREGCERWGPPFPKPCSAPQRFPGRCAASTGSGDSLGDKLRKLLLGNDSGGSSSGNVAGGSGDLPPGGPGPGLGSRASPLASTDLGIDHSAPISESHIIGTPNGGRKGPWGDWSGDDADWDEWKSMMGADLDDQEEVSELRDQVIEQRRQRAGRRRNVRDEYLRPMVDLQGIYNRLTYDEREAEERVFVEAITNQYESREALKYGGMLVAIPLVLGLVVSRLVAQPLWSYAESINAEAFALSDSQKVEGAHEIHLEELRLRMEASVGQAPALSDAEMLQHLQEEAQHLAEEFKDKNKRSLLNVVADSTSATAFFVMLARQTPQRQILFRTLGRFFTGLSDTAKAFLIILITDTLLGYHSEEGWTAMLKLLSGHYGVEAEEGGLKMFVALVPVVMDSMFKVWIFVGLNKQDPAAAVTLRQMDRH